MTMIIDLLMEMNMKQLWMIMIIDLIWKWCLWLIMQMDYEWLWFIMQTGMNDSANGHER